MKKVVLSLGSNMGRREWFLSTARELIATRVGELVLQTSVKETKSWGYDSGDYLNQVVECSTSLEPIDLLQVLKDIEIDLGRDPETKTKTGTCDYHDRTIDIDILYYEGVTMNTPELTIPHPQIQNRPFILELLDELKKQR